MMRWQERTALVSIPGFELHHKQLTLLSNIPKHVVKEFHAFLLQHLSVQKQKSASAFGQADWEPHEMVLARHSWKTCSEILNVPFCNKRFLKNFLVYRMYNYARLSNQDYVHYGTDEKLYLVPREQLKETYTDFHAKFGHDESVHIPDQPGGRLLRPEKRVRAHSPSASPEPALSEALQDPCLQPSDGAPRAKRRPRSSCTAGLQM